MYRHLKKLLTGVLSLTVLCAAAMPSMALDGTGNVASVDGQEYATVQEAINNGNGKTVTLLDDAKENVVIPEGATVTLDLGTFTLANNGASHTITNKGTLTIQGSGKVDNENHGKAALWNEGTAVLNGGTFDRSKEAGSSAEASGSNSYYTVVNHGNMTINDGVTITQNGKFSSLLENGWYNGAENKSGQPSVLTIKGGTFSGGLNTIKALAAPFVGHRFMPTGGVSTANVEEYLSSSAIIACGGTWMVKPALFADGDFSKVEQIAHEAMDVVKKVRG